jgi:hypothetical protein
LAIAEILVQAPLGAQHENVSIRGDYSDTLLAQTMVARLTGAAPTLISFMVDAAGVLESRPWRRHPDRNLY